jgi:uncharacterized protein YyaL (SSP411 family)
MPNRLAQETSPYLLQHQDNPVDWYAWGDAAFERARREDRPVLLSVGYSACHWCHVMAHESFEKPEIAALMNELFVNIKVDREERPDVDAIYMQAVQALTGRGGWPMTVFLTPDGRPFFGGTYYPPEDRQGLPGLPRVLRAVADAYRSKRDDIERAGNQLRDQIAASADVRPGSSLLTVDLLEAACDAILAGLDAEHGGFGRAPKFPQPMTLDFLMRHHRRTGRADALHAVELTLRAMANGGMYDQAGGGFHRYSTDAIWLVPHFEKMLYDNALLARSYLDAWKVTGDAFYSRIVRETLDYVLREMTDAGGAFYATQDADSEGEEGKFFLWTPGELEAVLGSDAALIGRFYGVSEAGNFEGSNILHVQQEPAAFAGSNAFAPADFEALLSSARSRLYAAREGRVHPGRDDKVITAWNGMMMRALAEAALAFDDEAYRAAASRNADFLLDVMFVDGRLMRTWKPPADGASGDSAARITAYLEDYALLADGLIAVYQATFEPLYLRGATGVVDEMIDLFWDDDIQGFYDTGRDAEELITRPRDFFDNATPSGTSVAADVLLRLGVLTDNTDYERRGQACLHAIAPYVERAPTAFGRLLAALDFHLSRPQELALVWPDNPGSARHLVDALRATYLPNLILVGARLGEGGDLTVLLQDRPLLDGKATAYLCERFVCQAPTTDAEELRRQIAAGAPA